MAKCATWLGLGTKACRWLMSAKLRHFARAKLSLSRQTMSKSRQPHPGREPRLRTLSMRYPDGFVLDSHRHPWAQLLFASTGVMQVETPRHTWVVPPHRALWVPADVEHRILMRGEVALRTAYFRPRTRLPFSEPRVIEVSPLLRELLVSSAKLGKLD